MKLSQQIDHPTPIRQIHRPPKFPSAWLPDWWIGRARLSIRIIEYGV